MIKRLFILLLILTGAFVIPILLATDGIYWVITGKKKMYSHMFVDYITDNLDL